MKANELMVGDWVLINGTPRKIQAVNGIDDEIMADDELYTLAEDRYHSEDKVDGVPLTPEILEKNEFDFLRNDNKDSVWNGWWIYEGLELATACLDKKGNWPCFINIYDSNITCEYVHQLQHALKLCKIEKEVIL